MHTTSSTALVFGLTLVAPIAHGQNAAPYAFAVDIAFSQQQPALIAHELTHVVQQSGGTRRIIVGSSTLPATGLQRAFAFENDTLRLLAAPTAFETVSKAVGIDGRIFGGAHQPNGWVPFLWVGSVGDSFGGPSGYAAEFATPQGGVVAMPVSGTGNLPAVISEPLGTWRPFDASSSAPANAHVDFLWHPTGHPTPSVRPIFFGAAPGGVPGSVLAIEWAFSTSANGYVSRVIGTRSGASASAVGMAGNTCQVYRVTASSGLVSTVLIDPGTNYQTVLAPPPGFATVAAAGVEESSGAIICQCNHLLRGTSEVWMYEPGSSGGYVPVRPLPLVGSIPAGFGLAAPSGPTGRLFSQGGGGFGLNGTDPTGLPTTIVFKPLFCRADTTGDDRTTTADLTELLGGFGGPASGPESGDFNGDGVITTDDLVVLLGDFGCGS